VEEADADVEGHGAACEDEVESGDENTKAEGSGDDSDSSEEGSAMKGEEGVGDNEGYRKEGRVGGVKPGLLVGRAAGTGLELVEEDVGTIDGDEESQDDLADGQANLLPPEAADVHHA